jgi:hypothetical protein
VGGVAWRPEEENTAGAKMACGEASERSCFNAPIGKPVWPRRREKVREEGM